MIAPMSRGILAGYNVHTAADRSVMLKSVGVDSIEELLHPIDKSIRLQRPLDLPPPLTEWALSHKMTALARRNLTTKTHRSWLGGGVYEHYIPETVHAIASRGEFLTAYTPYQPEMNQGILRILYDFQKLMGKVLGQPAVNCSVYDGSTALAEAAWMACRASGRDKLLVTENLWPQYRQVLATYLKGRNVEIVDLPSNPDSGQVDSETASALLKKQPFAGLIVQTPNRYGVIERLPEIHQLAHEASAVSIVACNPMLTGCFPSPGEEGFDIVCCEAQPLGLKLNAGGPYLGVIATRMELEQHLPGRIVGICQDLKGEPAFALVKENREQHVARHEATSHICSNQTLLALKVTVHLSTLGEHGFRRIAGLNVVKAHYLESQLSALPGVRRPQTGPFFNEFMLEVPCEVPALLDRLLAEQAFGGIDCSGWEPGGSRRLLIAVTELKSKTELDDYVTHFRQALQSLN